MKNPILPLFCLLLAGSFITSYAKDDLIQLVDKNSWVVVEAKDLSTLKEEFENNPIGEIWNEYTQKYMDFDYWKEFAETQNGEPLDDEDKEIFDTMEELWGKYEKFSEKLDGQIVFSVGGNLTEMLQNQMDGEDITPDVLFLAQTSAKEEDLDEILEWVIEKDNEVNEDREVPMFEVEEIEGVKVYFWDDHFHGIDLEDQIESLEELDGEGNDDLNETIQNLKDFNYKHGDGVNPNHRVATFISNGLFGICLGEENTVELLQQIEEGSSDTNIEELYINAFEEIDRADFNILLNATFLTEFFDFLKTNEDTQFPENPMKLTTKALLDGLSIDSMQTVALSTDITEEGAVLQSYLQMKNQDGIWRLLSLYKEHAALPPFIPENVLTASYVGYDFGQLWNTIDSILLNISPLVKGMMDFQIQVLENTHKINIRQDLLGNLGDQFVTFTRPMIFGGDKPLEEQMTGRDIYAVSLKNSELIERGLQQIIKTMFPNKMKTRAHKGVDIHYTNFLGESFFSYAITNQWLIISVGNPSDINQVLGHMSNPPANNLWTIPEVATAIREAPSDIIQWDYVDMDNLMKMMESMFKQLGQLDEDNPFFKEKLPELPFFMIGWSKETKGGFISEATLYPKEK